MAFGTAQPNRSSSKTTSAAGISRLRQLRIRSLTPTRFSWSLQQCDQRHFYDKLNFKFHSRHRAVASVARGPLSWKVIHRSRSDGPRFIAYAKARPGRINMASSGSGEQFIYPASCSRTMGCRIMHVPYRGRRPRSRSARRTGAVIFQLHAESIELHQGSKLRPLAVTRPRALRY